MFTAEACAHTDFRSS
ncbi:hypothetical protein AVEN_222437-1, partial [Araneus ventricosus]